MKLAVDIDAVTADGVAALIPWLKARGIILRHEDISKRDMPLPPDKNNLPNLQVSPTMHLGEAFDLAYHEHDVVLSAPQIPGARYSLFRLSTDNSIFFLTHRPRFCEAATKEWVLKNIGDYPIFHVNGTKANHDYDALIDDSVGNVREAVFAGKIGILFGASWNADADPYGPYSTYGPVPTPARLYRAAGWLDVISIIDALNDLSTYNGGRV